MKNKQELVSIILNCYNGEKFLAEALLSLKNQTYKNWELIFWDNRSTDSSKEIVFSFKFKNLRYFLSKKHTSLYEARNLAIKKLKENLYALSIQMTYGKKIKLKTSSSYLRIRKQQ